MMVQIKAEGSSVNHSLARRRPSSTTEQGFDCSFPAVQFEGQVRVVEIFDVLPVEEYRVSSKYNAISNAVSPGDA